MIKSILFSAVLLVPALHMSAQVRIGHSTSASVNSAAVLELGNDTAAVAGTWKTLKLPYVDFSNATVFRDNTVWGIAGSITDGILVYNTGHRTTNGFTGRGAYTWRNNTWIPMQKGTGKGSCSDPNSTSDPEQAASSLGCVTFTYRGQTVTYTTVRAADGNVWLQQNLGASRVATAGNDTAAYGHFFQWGRWDDGHQLRNSDTLQASTLTANNPSGLSGGSPYFYTGPATGDAWWWGGASSDTWSDAAIDATNGLDPCAALGPGWHIPDIAEWSSLVAAEGINTVNDAFLSNLKLPVAGYREYTDGSIYFTGTNGSYWSRSISSTPGHTDYLFLLGSANSTTIQHADRARGYSCRCVK